MLTARAGTVVAVLLLCAVPGPASAFSNFARCYLTAVRYAQRIEAVRTKAAALICDGFSLETTTARTNITVNALFRRYNLRLAIFGKAGITACDPDIFDGDPLPPYPLAEETLTQTMDMLITRTQACDGIGGPPPPPP